MGIVKNNLQKHAKKLLELINKFSKVSGYKINMKNQLHFYILTEKLRKQSQFQMHQKEYNS